MRRTNRQAERQAFRFKRADHSNKKGHDLYAQTPIDYQSEDGQWKTLYKRMAHMPALKLFHGTFINRNTPRAKMTLRELVLSTRKDGSTKDSVRFGLKRAVKMAGSDKRWVGIDYDKCMVLSEQSVNAPTSKKRRYAKRQLEQAERIWAELNWKLWKEQNND